MGDLFVLPGQEDAVRNAAEIDRQMFGLQVMGATWAQAERVRQVADARARRSPRPSQEVRIEVFRKAAMDVALHDVAVLDWPAWLVATRQSEEAE